MMKKSQDFVSVEVGGGAVLWMQHPCSEFHWRMLHEPHADQLVLAASLLDSMNSLLWDSISHTEACRRLKIMRKAWQAANYAPNPDADCLPNPQDHGAAPAPVHPVVGRTESRETFPDYLKGG